jgi:hypothetical protein
MALISMVDVFNTIHFFDRSTLRPAHASDTLTGVEEGLPHVVTHTGTVRLPMGPDPDVVIEDAKFSPTFPFSVVSIRSRNFRKKKAQHVVDNVSNRGEFIDASGRTVLWSRALRRAGCCGCAAEMVNLSLHH